MQHYHQGRWSAQEALRAIQCACSAPAADPPPHPHPAPFYASLWSHLNHDMKVKNHHVFLSWTDLAQLAPGTLKLDYDGNSVDLATLLQNGYLSDLVNNLTPALDLSLRFLLDRGLFCCLALHEIGCTK